MVAIKERSVKNERSFTFWGGELSHFVDEANSLRHVEPVGVN
jgi:hypothetical protein